MADVTVKFVEWETGKEVESPFTHLNNWNEGGTINRAASAILWELAKTAYPQIERLADLIGGAIDDCPNWSTELYANVYSPARLSEACRTFKDVSKDGLKGAFEQMNDRPMIYNFEGFDWLWEYLEQWMKVVNEGTRLKTGLVVEIW